MAGPLEVAGELDLVAKARMTPMTSAGVRGLAAELVDRDDLPQFLESPKAAADPDASALLMLAIATAGHPPSTDQAARVLPFVSDSEIFTVLVGATVGDRVTMLLDLVESGHMSDMRDGIALFLCAELLGESPPLPRLLTQMRLVGRRCYEPIPRWLLGVAASRVGDQNTVQALSHCIEEGAAPLAAKVADEVRRSFAGPPADVLPERPRLKAVSGFTVRRPAQKVSRNAPCPCGSGRKYKKCCLKADETRLLDPSPVAGLTMREYIAQAGQHMSLGDFGLLPPHQLLGLDFESLPSQHLLVAVRRLASFAFWDEAERAMDLLAERSDLPSEMDGYREELIGDALMAKAIDVALRQAAKLDDPDNLYDGFRLGLALAKDDSHILAEIEASAAVGLAANPDDPYVVPYALLPNYPALGIMTARGMIDPERDLDSVTLLDAIEEARDRLGLPPGDPFGDHYELMAGHHFDELDVAAEAQALTAENEVLAEELGELRQRLNAASARSRETERSLQAATERLAAAESVAAEARAMGEANGARSKGPDPEALRRKVEDLQRLVRDGNEQRRALRRQLAGTRERVQEDRPTSDRTTRRLPGDKERAQGESADDALETELDAPIRAEVLIPVFEDRARSAIGDAPLNVARGAVETAGGLAAGTEHAWRGAKQLRIAQGIYSARVGLHHRLLFELDPDNGRLVVLELILRRDLERRLARYR
jgi:hypothetical protein